MTTSYIDSVILDIFEDDVEAKATKEILENEDYEIVLGVDIEDYEVT